MASPSALYTQHAHTPDKVRMRGDTEVTGWSSALAHLDGEL